MTARPRPLHSGPAIQDATHVVVLMATHNGASVLGDQLDSLLNQSHTNWSLIVSDDGSTDTTRALVRRFARETPWHRVVLLRGPKRGAAQNFLSLLRAAGRPAFAAFCDQDDFWLPRKLEHAVGALADRSRPTLYGSRTIIADADLRPLRPSLRFRRSPGFGNALVQNIAGGNTMVMNRAALDILRPASLSATDIIAHDWWCYQMITGGGGDVILDERPGLLYRQHSENLIGANDSLRARLRRMRGVIDWQYAGWINGHIEALEAARDWLSPKACDQLDLLRQARNARMPNRLWVTWQASIYRQSVPGSAALWLAALFGRL